MGHPVIRASTPCPSPPTWAVLQRRLFDVLDRAWRVFSEACTEPGGRLAFDGVIGVPPDDRDGVDDFYEPFFNWPLLYVLGGSADLLDAAKRHWSAVTAQLTELGMLAGGHDRGYDWFHQGEGLLFFYNLCLADPHDADLRAQALRSAALYLPDGPGNYDPGLNIITAPHNGADGPRPGLTAEPAVFPWSPVFQQYGLPLGWIPGIDEYGQLLTDPAAAALMGREMRDRMGRGDIAANLAVTSLMTLAHLATGEDVYRDWVLRYSGGWLGRQRANGGLLPDNVGRSGEVGEYLEGRWYGGHYGWSWPHGLHTVGAAAVVAACNAVAVGGDNAYFELGRGPLDAVMRRLRPREDGDRESSGIATVPFKHDDRGWFCPKPMQMSLPVALWHASQAVPDGERIERLRRASGDRAWREILPVRTKEEAGHETPWLAYLSGGNTQYPERALGVALGQVAERLAAIAQRPGPSEPSDLHHWQQLNPVVTEILSQLTCGAPQQIYNGGLWYSRIRYHRDPQARRPGLPDEVAALVTGMDAEHVALQLVNLDPVSPRRVLIQAGAYAEHEFGVATDDHTGGRWPIDGRFVEVVLPPAHTVALRLTQRLRVHPPRLAATPQSDRNPRSPHLPPIRGEELIVPAMRPPTGGTPVARPAPSSVAALGDVGSATACAKLHQLGLTRTFIDGPRPLQDPGGLRVVGAAITLQFMPKREDVFSGAEQEDVEKTTALWAVLEAVEPGDVLVVQAYGSHFTGCLGDMLVRYFRTRGGAGIVVDGRIRDAARVKALGVPVWCTGVTPHYASQSELFPWAWNVPVAVGGALVFPGDIVVADDDGAVVVPPDYAARVAESSLEHQDREEFARERIDAGGRLSDYYPLSSANEAEYLAARAAQRAGIR